MDLALKLVHVRLPYANCIGFFFFFLLFPSLPSPKKAKENVVDYNGRLCSVI